MDRSKQGVRLVEACAVLAVSDGGTRAFLALCDDGNQYWVKSPNNPQGARTLIPERVVAALGGLIDAPIPTTSLIQIPQGLPDAYRLGGVLEPGVGHGSLHIENALIMDEWEVFLGHDDNRSRQAVIAALWDLCLGDDPQWLHAVNDDYSISSFDHNFWLASESEFSVEALERLGHRAWNDAVNPDVTSRAALRSVADRLDRLERADFQTAVGTVPLEWNTTSAEMSRLSDYLCSRADAVAARMREAAEHSKHP